MQESELPADAPPSRTAYGAAVHRALHQDLDGGLIFSDPLAWQVLGVDVAERERLVEQAREQDRPTLRTFIAMRHRFGDEAVAQAVLRGVDQVLVLGAGLDTFGLRNAAPGRAVFELDLPQMSAWKQSMLSAAEIPIPDSLHFVAGDLARDDWLQLLAASGLSKRATTVLWFGVSPYLAAPAVKSTLAKLSTIPGVEVVFDYATTDAGLSGEAKELRDRLGNRVAALGEPFRSSWGPDEMAALLRDLGFDEIEDLGPRELASRYLRRPGLRAAGGGGGHLVRARRTRWGE